MVSKISLKKYHLSMLFALLLTISLFEFHGTSLSSEMASSVADYAASTDTWSRSSISMPATQNLVFSSPNLTTLEIPSQASPINLTTLSIDVVRGLEPMQRFDSAFTSARVRENNVANPNLTTTNNGISLSYDASSYPSYVVYNLSFVTPSIIHSADLISLGFSTDSSFNSSQGLIGVSFVLRDAQNARYYISVIVSDQNPADSFGLSEWFLGESYTSQFLKYPTYSLRYNSLWALVRATESLRVVRNSQLNIGLGRRSACRRRNSLFGAALRSSEFEKTGRDVPLRSGPSPTISH
jgi:hypothetical protein